jgi:hypothetical protein
MLFSHQLVTLAVALLASASVAQTSLFLPSEAAAGVGTGANAFPWGNQTSSMRIQHLYDSGEFIEQDVPHAIVITGARWRANSRASSWTGGQYSNVQVYLGSSARDVRSPSSSFAANRSSDFTLVHDGSVQLLPGSSNGPGVPAPVIVELSFQTSFSTCCVR